MTERKELKHIILFNGPPGSGKDACCNYMWRKYGVKSFKIATTLKYMAHLMLGLPYPEDLDRYEGMKEISTSLGVTLRQVYIDIGLMMKKKYGHKVWTNALVEKLRPVEGATVSDLGFRDELEHLLEHFKDRLVIVQLYREGKDFSNDSRGYVDGAEYGIPTIELINNGPIQGLYDRLDMIYNDLAVPVKEYRLTRNAVQCNVCKDVIESKHVHDYQRCSCGACMVDGGLDYQRLALPDTGFVNLSQYEEVV